MKNIWYPVGGSPPQKVDPLTDVEREKGVDISLA
jgi:hypothetical protein